MRGVYVMTPADSACVFSTKRLVIRSIFSFRILRVRKVFGYDYIPDVNPA